MNPSQKCFSGAAIIACLCTMAIFLGGAMADVYAEYPLIKCRAKPVTHCQPIQSDQPRCAIELTCTDKFVKLGNPDGVCFRPTCPGVWALIHRSTDQNSFRRKFITYRHYTFVGYWQLKDRGVLESGALPTRELFLVLPDDLIELKMTLPDCNARIEVKNLGYIKKGTLSELRKWLAYQSYLARADSQAPAPRSCDPTPPCAKGIADWRQIGSLSRLQDFCKSVGLLGW